MSKVAFSGVTSPATRSSMEREWSMRRLVLSSSDWGVWTNLGAGGGSGYLMVVES